MHAPPPPPTADALSAGTQLVAGCGVATVLPDMDFETYSEAGFVFDGERWRASPGAASTKRGLTLVGAAVYSEHPTCEVLSFAYDLKDRRGRRIWHPGQPKPGNPSRPQPLDLFAHLANGGLIEAHNAAFEAWIWRNVCVPRYGWPPLPVAQLRCSMAKARAHALPGALEPLGDVLAIATRKDKDGARLLAKFSIPRNPTKTDARRRIRPADDPTDAQRLYAYNSTDIVAEAQASACIPDLSSDELEFWQHDTLINTRGVAVDREAISNCTAIIEQAYERYNGELAKITGGVADTASQTERIKGWLHSRGVHLDSLDDEAVTGALARCAAGDERRVLQIRQLVSSASVKKLYALLHQTTAAGRVHDLFSYHAARTGRAAGNGPQPQNLPKDGPDVYHCVACSHWFGANHHPDPESPRCSWCGVLVTLDKLKPLSWGYVCHDDAFVVLATRSLDAVEFYFGDALALIVGCLRGLFVAADGHDLIASDFSAIEAVVLAALAGERWRLDVFATRGDIYLASGSRATGIPYEKYLEHKKTTGQHHPHRQQFKVAELSGGFGGWIGAWKQFGADEFFENDNAMKAAILALRAASPAIVEMWGGQWRGPPWARERQEFFGLEGCAIAAVLNPGASFTYAPPGGCAVAYFMRGDALYCVLPSGRLLTYHRPRLHVSERNADEYALSYEGWNTNPKMGVPGWVRMNTYGGKLTENVVQAVARDILYDAKRRLENAGYPNVLHVHDEVVAEIAQGVGSVEHFEAVMGHREKWYADWPVNVSGGWRGRRYRKD